MSSGEEGQPYLAVSHEVVSEVRYEMHSRLRSYGHAHPTQVGPGIGCNQWVANTSNHLREADEGLCVLLVGEETIAFHDGCLHVAGWS